MTGFDLDAVQQGGETPVAATTEALEEISQDLADAFADDPLFDWFMRPDAGRAAARRRLFRVLLRETGLPDGVVERPALGGAAAVWLRSETLGSPSLRREGLLLATLLDAAGIVRFARLLRLRAAMDRHHPAGRPHDYLWFLGVRPELQGRGIGSTLLASRTRRLDAAGRPAFLETATPRNLDFYRRHGFAPVAEYHPAPDAPLIWALWREPQC